ncbi:hypothetical protein J2736_005436, partial [Paenibacillus qinlingensis]|nr:hypothetical protein [Paenibacillus qinlingensis]
PEGISTEEPNAMTRTFGSVRGPCNYAWAYSIE